MIIIIIVIIIIIIIIYFCDLKWEYETWYAQFMLTTK